ncbi:hypothetical protein AAC387_Pa10g0777 [Persea americana]
MDGKGSDGRFILVDLGFRILRFLWDYGWGMSTRLEGGKDGLEWAFGGMGPRCSSGFGLGLTVEGGARRAEVFNWFRVGADMYSKCFCIWASSSTWDEICERDRVSWNSIISGCVHYREIEVAHLLFEDMLMRRNVVF